MFHHMMKMLRQALFVMLLSTAAAWAQTLPQGARIAYFGLHFTDTSTEGAMNGARADETARLAKSQAYVADQLTARGYVLVPLDPVREELDRTLNPGDCNGCAARMAQRLGADYVVTGLVQKTSNLILAINLFVTRAGSNDVVAQGVVDIRGNTDDSWQRGLRYILKNRIFFD
jgi:hypothetical protein